MQLNSVSPNKLSFGTSLAIVGGKTVYSNKQKQLINTIKNHLKNSSDSTTTKVFDEISDCVILAKPVDENGIILQAYIKDYNPLAEWTTWYDKINGSGDKVTSAIARDKKTCISAIDNMISQLDGLNNCELLSKFNYAKGELTAPMKIAPKAVDIYG